MKKRAAVVEIRIKESEEFFEWLEEVVKALGVLKEVLAKKPGKIFSCVEEGKGTGESAN